MLKIDDVHVGQIIRANRNSSWYMNDRTGRKYNEGTLFKIINKDECYIDVIFLVNKGPDDKNSIASGCDPSYFNAL